jgi:hypothetical protein
MLYFIEETPELLSNKEHCWSFGHPFPRLKGACLEVRAFGHELEYLKSNFRDLPMAHKSVVIWKGEMAQFIYDNLPDDKYQSWHEPREQT